MTAREFLTNVTIILAVMALGAVLEVLVPIQRLLQATNGTVEHANIRLWAPLDRMLSLFWVTPNVHKIHHSRQLSETNSNYANLLTVYDRLLGTYTPSDRASSVKYGLDDAEEMGHASFAGLVAMPFQRTTPAQREEKVSAEASLGQ